MTSDDALYDFIMRLKHLRVENSLPKFSEISVENLYIEVIFLRIPLLKSQMFQNIMYRCLSMVLFGKSNSLTLGVH